MVKVKDQKRRVNYKILFYGFFGLACLALTYYVHWLFILGCAIAIWINQKEILGKN